MLRKIGLQLEDSSGTIWPHKFYCSFVCHETQKRPLTADY